MRFRQSDQSVGVRVRVVNGYFKQSYRDTRDRCGKCVGLIQYTVQPLASCSADKTVKIWEERVDPEAKNPWIWKRRAQFLESRESVESIEFAPKHLGLKLATGSSDGWIRIYKTENQLDVAHWQCEHKFLIRPLKTIPQ